MIKKLPHICFIGCGWIAANHAKILRSLYPKINLSFASEYIKDAQKYCKKYKGVSAFSTYEEAVNSKDIDIIFITTPHAYHSEIAIAAANAGKDIIIEKPVTRSTAELKKVLSAVKKNKVRCTVAENYMYKPIIKKILKVINDGLIGKVLMIKVNRTHKNDVTGWRTDKVLMGGGAMLEGGVHWINFLNTLAQSQPNEVLAVKPNIQYSTNVPFEDTLSLNVKYQNGICADLLYSWSIPNPFKGLSYSKIYGTEGIINFESNGLYFSVYGKKCKKFFNFSDFLGFKAMNKAFVEDYINDRPWLPNMDRIAMELQMVEKAYLSIKSKKFETIG